MHGLPRRGSRTSAERRRIANGGAGRARRRQARAVCVSVFRPSTYDRRGSRRIAAGRGGSPSACRARPQDSPGKPRRCDAGATERWRLDTASQRDRNRTACGAQRGDPARAVERCRTTATNLTRPAPTNQRARPGNSTGFDEHTRSMNPTRGTLRHECKRFRRTRRRQTKSARQARSHRCHWGHRSHRSHRGQRSHRGHRGHRSHRDIEDVEDIEYIEGIDGIDGDARDAIGRRRIR